VEAQSFGSEVPSEYYPDWKISDDYEQMKSAFATLDATIKLSEDPDVGLFRQLLDNFETVFPYFPKQAHHQQTYTQCEIITAILAKEYSSQDYAKFKNKCFEDIR
jgi:predicted SAM-dependent methyltransferase